MEKKYFVFDSETTGLTPPADKVIEIAFAQIDNMGNLTDEKFHTLINPERPIPIELTEKVHGITNEMVSDKPKFADIAYSFVDFIKNKENALSQNYFIAHNADFDINFINSEMQNSGIDEFKNFDLRDYGTIIDTCALSRKTFATGRHSLDALCKRFQIDLTERVLHGAMIDCKLLGQAFVKLIDYAENQAKLVQTKSVFFSVDNSEIGDPTIIDVSNEALKAHKNLLDAMNAGLKMLG